MFWTFYCFCSWLLSLSSAKSKITKKQDCSLYSSSFHTTPKLLPSHKDNILLWTSHCRFGSSLAYESHHLLWTILLRSHCMLLAHSKTLVLHESTARGLSQQQQTALHKWKQGTGYNHRLVQHHYPSLPFWLPFSYNILNPQVLFSFPPKPFVTDSKWIVL